MHTYLQAIDQWEKHVEAFVDWDRSAAIRRAERGGDGPISGWPIGVKDIVDVEALPTRCNSTLTPDTPAGCNAPIVQCLIDNGAFVMAKTVTTTFASFDPGPTRNPWNLQHTPGGSSSGSAAAVACGMVRLALGSQTVGSVNRPAAFCGVVGFKPTYGWYSTEGMFPFSQSVDTVGCFTRSVADMQTAFSALKNSERVSALTHKIRIGRVDDLHTDPADEQMREALDRCCQQFNTAGMIVESVDLSNRGIEPGLAAAHASHWALVAAEAADVHKQWFSQRAMEYPPALAGLIKKGLAVPPEKIALIQEHRTKLRSAFEALFVDYDLLLNPSAPGPAPEGINATGDPRFNLIWTYTGHPTITLPMQLSREGLPLGMQLVGPMQGEGGLLGAAAAIEATLDFDCQPRL